MREREVHVVAAEQDVPTDRDTAHREPRRSARLRNAHEREVGGAAADVTHEDGAFLAATFGHQLADGALASHRRVERGRRLLEEHGVEPSLLRRA